MCNLDFAHTHNIKQHKYEEKCVIKLIIKISECADKKELKYEEIALLLPSA